MRGNTSQVENNVAQMNTNAKAGWICLAVGWVVYLLPIPLFGLGLLIAGGLCFAALILAIISMNKGTGGLGLLLATLIGTPLVYILSWFTWMLSV